MLSEMKVSQCSVQSPAKKTACLIEKETSLEPNKFNNGNLLDFDCGIPTAGDDAMIAIKRLFFAAGSRSHEKLM
jgi:hypothetical protein